MGWAGQYHWLPLGPGACQGPMVDLGRVEQMCLTINRRSLCHGGGMQSWQEPTRGRRLETEQLRDMLATVQQPACLQVGVG